jgi:hypothetical protein
MRRSRWAAGIESAALVASVLTLAAGAGAAGAADARQGAVRLQIANPRPGPGGAIIPAGETVTLIITVRPAQLLVGHGGQEVVQVRGVKNFPGGPTNFENRLEGRLKTVTATTDSTYRSTNSCRRTPCRLQVRSKTAGVWDFKAVLLRGSRPVDWSPSVRVVWHTDPTSVTLEGPNNLSCTKRLPNSGVSGDGLICRGTVTHGKEEIFVVPSGTQVQLTAKANPGIPAGWTLKIAETGRVICEVPRQHPSATNSCTGFAAEGNPPEFRKDRAWNIDLKLLEYGGLTGPFVGIFGSLHELSIWWGCPFRGIIPQCP